MLQLQADQLVSTITDFVCVCVYLSLGRWNFELAPLVACIRQKGSLKSESNLSLKSQDDTQHENPDLCTSLFQPLTLNALECGTQLPLPLV